MADHQLEACRVARSLGEPSNAALLSPSVAPIFRHINSLFPYGKPSNNLPAASFGNSFPFSNCALAVTCSSQRHTTCHHGLSTNIFTCSGSGPALVWPGLNEYRDDCQNQLQKGNCRPTREIFYSHVLITGRCTAVLYCSLRRARHRTAFLLADVDLMIFAPKRLW